MYLQRQYDDQKRLTGVQVLHTGLSPEQNFSRRLVMQGLSEGWLALQPGHLVVKATPEDLRYAILAEPGYYCISTGERIPISALAWEQAASQPEAVMGYAEAQAWLAANGKDSRDYRVTMAYECVLEASLHEKYRAVSEGGIVRPARAAVEA